jgi:hypothetical protein
MMIHKASKYFILLFLLIELEYTNIRPKMKLVVKKRKNDA